MTGKFIELNKQPLKLLNHLFGKLRVIGYNAVNAAGNKPFDVASLVHRPRIDRNAVLVRLFNKVLVNKELIRMQSVRADTFGKIDLPAEDSVCVGLIGTVQETCFAVLVNVLCRGERNGIKA